MCSTLTLSVCGTKETRANRQIEYYKFDILNVIIFKIIIDNFLL